jgi:hypothetical protein
MSLMRAGIAGQIARVAMAAFAVGALLPSTAIGQTESYGSASSPWRYAFTVYGYLPSIAGSTKFPVDTGSSVDVSAKEILDRLKMAAMGSFEAHNGTWGISTDLVYVDFGKTNSGSRDFTLGGTGIPAGTSASLGWDLKATLLTVAGEYRLKTDPAWTADLLGGVRLLNLREHLNWSIAGNLGPIAPASRTGSSDVSQNVVDAIVGIKARYVFGSNREWSVPLYADVGTGGSASTSQFAAGIGYRFSWGELTGMWRYIGYRAKSGQAVNDLTLSGPQIAAVFRW